MFLYAFDLIELNSDDLRRDPLEVRKATPASVLAKAKAGAGSLPSCSQGDVSVANQSYTSSKECYADGAKRAKGASLSALKEGKSKSEQTSIRNQYDAMPACA